MQSGLAFDEFATKKVVLCITNLNCSSKNKVWHLIKAKFTVINNQI